jgi:hypothetical protein
MMYIAQVASQAAEAGKSGISVFLDAGVIGLILTNSFLLIKAWIDRKAVKKALSDDDQTHPCEAHAERLLKLEALSVPDKEKRLSTLEANYLTSAKAIDDMRRENREDHHQIFEAIAELGK